MVVAEETPKIPPKQSSSSVSQSVLAGMRRLQKRYVHALEQYMFVVSGHLYKPLPLSQPCGLKVKIIDSFGTASPTFLGAGLSILVFLWHLSPVRSAIWRGFKEP